MMRCERETTITFIYIYKHNNPQNSWQNTDFTTFKQTQVVVEKNIERGKPIVTIAIQTYVFWFPW